MILSDRLIIRPPTFGDAKPLHDAINYSLPELIKWMPWAFNPNLKTTEAFIARGIEQWSSNTQTEFPLIIQLKSSNQLIGASGFNENSRLEVPMFEIGYWIATKFSGHGYATEAVNAITQLAFDRYQAARVQICAQVDNIKSTALARRCGYKEEAVLKNFRIDCQTRKPCDEAIYACFSKEQLAFRTPIEYLG
ncbi:acetyltransferase [Legionella beliardensis]|uniref:Acetyltransferase n=1 Tax=Legionella beliardensis TaxID=91822 RepID=A0A378JQT3_9GAMM|nr:GNAT family N-acetyltransferase [Legionella beliardensis]STX55560.1 acetyltransferase [Legionella beliardensis]